MRFSLRLPVLGALSFKLTLTRILKFMLLVETVALICNAAFIRRDYQDSWILEGLEFPFVLFVVTYAIVFFSEKRISRMVALAVLGRSIFLIIPSLKYVWFQGIYIDQHIQYALANYVCNKGFIAPQSIPYAAFYGNTPLFHLAFSIFSIISSTSLVNSMKYLPVLMSPIYPLLTYAIVEKLVFSPRQKFMKHALFISSLPVAADQYFVNGNQFGSLLAFLVLFSIIMLLQKNDRCYFFVFLCFIFALAGGHSVSSVMVAVFLFAIVVLQNVRYFQLKSYLKALVAFTAIFVSAAWLQFPAYLAFKEILRVLFVDVWKGVTPRSEFIFPRFFELAHADMAGAMKSILVYDGADVLFLLTTLAGLIIMLNMRKQLNDTSRFLFLFTGVVLLFFPIGLVLKVGLFRVLYYLRPLFPVFSSIFVLYLIKNKAWIRVLLLSSIILLVTVQLYSCQLLIPPANILLQDLPADEPLVYVNKVNTIYQRQMVYFAMSHISRQIACDISTKNQIIGLTDFNFSRTHIVDYYPLDRSQSEKEYNFFLIHFPGIGGPFVEQAEKRTGDLIRKAAENSSIIYTNGESYVLTEPFLYSKGTP